MWLWLYFALEHENILWLVCRVYSFSYVYVHQLAFLLIAMAIIIESIYNTCKFCWTFICRLFSLSFFPIFEPFHGNTRHTRTKYNWMYALIMIASPSTNWYQFQSFLFKNWTHSFEKGGGSHLHYLLALNWRDYFQFTRMRERKRDWIH